MHETWDPVHVFASHVRWWIVDEVYFLLGAWEGGGGWSGYGVDRRSKIGGFWGYRSLWR